MKAKYVLWWLGIAIFGSLVTAVIDDAIGINLKDTGSTPRIIHTAAYLLWGMATLLSIQKLLGK